MTVQAQMIIQATIQKNYHIKAQPLLLDFLGQPVIESGSYWREYGIFRSPTWIAYDFAAH